MCGDVGAPGHTVRWSRPWSAKRYTYAYAAISRADGRMDSLILPHVNGQCMQLFIDEVTTRYPNERLVLVLDGAGWHRSAAIRLPDNLRLLLLPPYSPELNPVEPIWDDLREKHFHNPVFDSIDDLKITSNTPFGITKTTPSAWPQSPSGHG